MEKISIIFFHIHCGLSIKRIQIQQKEQVLGESLYVYFGYSNYRMNQPVILKLLLYDIIIAF